ncbi:NAD(P)/FAD-dependent oxidoreductase [Spirosoma luteolum]
MAGLTAAYYLEKSGLTATIYEAQDRLGGRVLSAKDLVADGVITEIGGEFIDSTHDDILNLCRTFNLSLLDTQTPQERNLISRDYFIGGQRYSEQAIIQAFGPVAARIQRDVARLRTASGSQQTATAELDYLSVDAYLQRVGLSGWLYELLTTSFTSELGISSSDQSSLNLLNSLSTDTSNGFEIYGSSDERYKVVGGNERLIQGLYSAVKSEIRAKHLLTRLAATGSGYSLSFDNGTSANADVVIITVPFSVLRNVELQVDMPKRKRQCIQELGYGTQSKMFIGVSDRVWRHQGYSGYVLSNRVHNGWDSSQMQNGNAGPGGYSLFLGADKGKNLTINQYESYLTECDIVYPGIAQAADRSRKGFYNWNNNLMARGAYACYKVGQVTSIGGIESQSVGNILFAGEHCSGSFQGYMNGAAETGRKAAESILRRVKHL